LGRLANGEGDVGGEGAGKPPYGKQLLKFLRRDRVQPASRKSGRGKRLEGGSRGEGINDAQQGGH